jgi:hypothetical protein
VLRRKKLGSRRKPERLECVRNARDSVRRILRKSNCSSRGRRKQQGGPRSGAGNRRPSWLRLRRMACGVVPARPPPNHHLQSAHPHALRAPRPQAHQGCLVVEARPAGGVLVNRSRPPRVPQVTLLLHQLRPKSQERQRIRMTGSRPQKTSGSHQDCGISNELVVIRSFMCHF